MLKTVLYYLLLLTTSVRCIDLIYLLSQSQTNLPVPVILVTTAMILYGVVLLAKKFFGAVRLKQLAWFYLIQTAMIIFNIAFTAVANPLSVNGLETLVVGSFLDILVNLGILFLCYRQLRGRYVHTSRF